MSKTIDYRTKVTILSALIGVLSLTAVLGWAFSQQSVAQRQSQESLLAGFQPSAVRSLEVGSDTLLVKSTGWTVQLGNASFPGASDRIDTYLKTLEGLKKSRLVTRDGDGKPFGLDSGFKTLKIAGEGSKVLFELQVGNTNELGDQVYVRLAGQKEIWETDSGFSRSLGQDFNAWADLSLFPGRKDGDLTRVAFDSRIETADKTVFAPFDLVKSTKDGKSVWENRLTKTSTEAMATWAQLVPSFRFAGFVSAQDGPSTTTSLGTVSLTWSDGSTTTIKIGPPDGQNRYRASDGAREFWLSDWSLGQLLFNR